MNLKHILVISLIALSSMFPKVLAQTVSGYITNLFDEQPIDSALVHVEDLGEDYTDEFGFYQIGGSYVDPYFSIPQNRIPDKLEVVNILGQRVLLKNISLDDIIGENLVRVDNLQNVASGMYPFRIFDKNNNIYASGLIPNIEGSNISLAPFNIVEPKRSSNGGRSVNSLDDISNVTITRDGYYDRLTFMPTPSGNVGFDEGIIPIDDTFLEHMNTVLGRNENYGSIRWPENVNPIFKIWPYFIGNNQPVSQLEINKVISAVDTIAFYSEELFNGNITGQYEVVDSIPTDPNGIVFVYWDSSIPFNSAVGLATTAGTHEVYYGSVCFKFEGLPQNIFLVDVIKTVTASQSDSDIIIPSIFNYSPIIDYLAQDDKNLIKANNSRAPNWKSPDKNTY